MFTKAQIDAASDVMDDTTIAMAISAVRASQKYKTNPGFYADLQTKLEDADGSTQAKQIVLAVNAIAAIGTGAVELDQRKTIGTDGVYYSQIAEREALVEYMLTVLYEEPFESILVDPSDPNSVIIISGTYGIGQREVKLELL